MCGPPLRRVVSFLGVDSPQNLNHTTRAARGSQAERRHDRRGSASALRAAGSLADAARSIASHAAVTVGRPLASRIAPRNALQVPSPSKRMVQRGAGKGPAVPDKPTESNMRLVSVAGL